MKLIATSLDAAQVTWGAHPLRFAVQADGSADVPRFAVPALLASGKFRLPDGVTNDVHDIRAELETCTDSELDVYLNSRIDPDSPSGNIQTHYFNAHRHPLSDRARSLGDPEIADELDNLFQQHHLMATKGRGVTMHATEDQKRVYALAYFDAEAAGKRPPSIPWRQPVNKAKP